MESRTNRIILRATLIGLQWLGLTIGLGSLVMRSDQSFSQVISPHFGVGPVIIGAIAAGFLLGLTVEAPRYLVPLVIMMCVGASSFVGIVSYAPVADGLILRTAALDNFVSQRILLMSLVMLMVIVPAAVAGNLLGANLRVRQEVAPHPEDLEYEQETPWWEQRHDSKTQTDTETGQHTA